MKHLIEKFTLEQIKAQLAKFKAALPEFVCGVLLGLSIGAWLF